jgi:outer membrane protein assembly factor BamB
MPGIVLAAAVWSVVSAVSAGDWPMQRYDAARSAVSPYALPDRLEPLWVWHLPPRNAMFGPDRRSRIDGSYCAAIVGKTLFLGCEYNGSLVALDTETGAEKWRFFAEGAVRFSPAAANGRLYFGADDGRLYCLDAADGKLLWRFDGAPTPQKIVNHGKIASKWPVTGGAVVADGVVCFACGAWPLDGVLIYGVDARSGKLLWHHDTWEGVANGYLAVRDGQLVLKHVARGGLNLDVKTGAPSPPKKDADAGLFWRKARDLWQAADTSELPGGVEFPAGWDPYQAIAQAGRRTFGAGMLAQKGQPDSAHGIVGIDELADGGKPRVAFAFRTDSRVLDVACGDDKLFVMTQDGRIACFGRANTERKEAEAVHRQLDEPRFAEKPDATDALVARILERTKQAEGYCLVWGLGDGRMVEELLRQSKLLVCAVDPDAKKVEAIRRKLDAAGLYRGRLQIYTGEPASYAFPPHVANLIVSEDLAAAGSAAGAEFFGVMADALRPYGGTACFALGADQYPHFTESVSKAKRGGVRFRITSDLAMLVREGPLPGAADWTHETRDAANSLCSPDKLIRAPMSVLWFGGAAADIGRTYGTMLPPGLLVCEGRYYMQGPDKMAAIDAYTGRLMWEVPLPKIQPNATRYGTEIPPYPAAPPGEISVAEISRGTGLNAVAASDALYVAVGGNVLVLDPATGRTQKTLAMPLADPQIKKPCWGRLFVEGDLLLATVFDPAIVEACFLGWANNNEKNKDRLPMAWLVAVDRHSGKLAWKHKAATAFNGRAVAIGNGRVYCTDALTPDMHETLLKAGRNVQTVAPTVVALDVKTGRKLWSQPIDVAATKIGYSAERDVLLLPARSAARWVNGRWEAPPPAREKRQEAPGHMLALRGRDGKELWRVNDAEYPEPFLIWHDVAMGRDGTPFDVETGQRHRRQSPAHGGLETWSVPKGGCNYMVGSDALVTCRTQYFDAQHFSGRTPLLGMRSGCTPSIIPAGGVMSLLNYTEFSTDPYRTAAAFVHDPRAVNWKEYVPGRGEGGRELRHIALNLAAPGDHAAPDGTIWFRQALPDGKRKRAANPLGIDVTIRPDPVEAFCFHPLRIRRTDEDAPAFVAASGAVGIESLEIGLGGKNAAAARCSVRLHFAEPENLKAGQRVFDVAIQGKEVLRAFDVAAAAGGPRRAVVKDFREVDADGLLRVTFSPRKSGKPAVLCGIEVLRH